MASSQLSTTRPTHVHGAGRGIHNWQLAAVVRLRWWERCCAALGPFLRVVRGQWAATAVLRRLAGPGKTHERPAGRPWMLRCATSGEGRAWR